MTEISTKFRVEISVTVGITLKSLSNPLLLSYIDMYPALNQLWKYDLTQLVWSKIVTTYQPGPVRVKGVGWTDSSGNFVLFGGQNSNGGMVLFNRK